MLEGQSRERDTSIEEGMSAACRDRLPAELEHRLCAVWDKLGHLIEWCPNTAAWTALFLCELRPYRETFYWEAVRDMVGNYLREHPTDCPESSLTDCLVATQCSAVGDDTERVVYFREAWRQILSRSRDHIEDLIQADLDLAKQDGTYQRVARLYAGDYYRWEHTR